MKKIEEDLAWSLYWADGPLHSCVAGADPEDQQHLDSIWAEFAKSLPGGATVLDAATGNGAVASLMFRERGDLKIDAVDKAKIAPPDEIRAQPEGKLEFYSELDVLNLPFKERSFDAICSQFGIEYAGLSAAVNALLPLLAPNASFMFIVHNTNSELIRSSFTKETELEVLVAEGGLLGSLLSVLRGELSLQSFEQLGQDYINGNGTKTNAISGQVFSGIEQVLKLLESDSRAALDLAVTLNLRCQAEHSRLVQMREAANDESQIIKAIKSLQKVGRYQVSYTPLYLPGKGTEYLIAWSISGRSPDE